MKIKTFLSISIAFLFLLQTTTTIEAVNSWNNNKISSKDAVPSNPQLSAGTKSYGIVWEDNRSNNTDLYFAQINFNGNRVGKESRITENSVHDLTPSLVWNGSDYGLFWSYDKSQIYFTRLSEKGDKLSGDIPTVTDTAGYAIHISSVWNGQEYGVVWWDVRNAPSCNPSGTRGRAFFVRVDKDGQKIGDEIPVTEAFSNTWQDYKPLITWDGGNYVIFWNDSREAAHCNESKQNIYMAKINSNGQKILGDIKLQKSSTNSNLYSVIWDGTNYAITYNVGTSMFAKMDTDGNTIIADVPINSNGFSGSPKISWDGSSYFASWFDNRDKIASQPNNNEVYFVPLDVTGDKAIPETRITSQKESSYDNTQIVFLQKKNKKKMGIAWLEYRKGANQIYFASN